MSLIDRIHNLWKLSELGVPEVDNGLYKEEVDLYYPDMIAKKSDKKAQFIPYQKTDPIKEITEEKHD